MHVLADDCVIECLNIHVHVHVHVIARVHSARDMGTIATLGGVSFWMCLHVHL